MDRWKFWAILFLGLWLTATSVTFGGAVDMSANDFLTGVFLTFASVWGLYNPKRGYWMKWVLCLTGIWLQFAPLALWAGHAFNYLNDTLTGALVIVFAVLIPEKVSKTASGSVPRGWKYNPSAWSQRFPIAFLAFLCWMFARYMAAYQLGYIHTIWDPVFHDGTEKVITSRLSQQFPVSDAGLGAMAYTIEMLMALHGGERRWHTIPWFVILFAIVVVPLGIVSITLIILQPILVHHWCFWCLLTAVCMLLMITLAFDEAIAVLQYLKQKKEKGFSLWEVLWKGGSAADAHEDSSQFTFSSLKNGISTPWNLAAAVLIGAWLMFGPPLFQMTPLLANQARIIGAFTITISIICMAEVVRYWRMLLIPFGIWAIGDAFYLSGALFANHLLAGTAIILLSLPRGKIRGSYGDIRPG